MLYLLYFKLRIWIKIYLTTNHIPFTTLVQAAPRKFPLVGGGGQALPLHEAVVLQYTTSLRSACSLRPLALHRRLWLNCVCARFSPMPSLMSCFLPHSPPPLPPADNSGAAYAKGPGDAARRDHGHQVPCQQ